MLQTMRDTAAFHSATSELHQLDLLTMPQRQLSGVALWCTHKHASGPQPAAWAQCADPLSSLFCASGPTAQAYRTYFEIQTMHNVTVA